jgi:hypothetical protein
VGEGCLYVHTSGPGSTLPPRDCRWRFRGEVNQAAATRVRGVFRRNPGAEAETSE